MDEKSNEIAHAPIVAREEHGGFLQNLEFATRIWILVGLQHGFFINSFWYILSHYCD